jgi:2-methylcitrate dehydratase PrpD
MSHAGYTRSLAEYAAGLRDSTLPADVSRIAQHCVLDWLAVTLAGCNEPLVHMLYEELAEEGGSGTASVIGLGHRMTARQAALVNGTASHALDLDDVHLPSRVHPSVAVLPAAAAQAQARGLGGQALIAAFVAGVEVQSRIATWLGASHYRRGWHSTGTIGVFGATAAAAALEQLPVDALTNAFGIAGTSAAGLRASFGTMCKPLHAGQVGANAILAAGLAKRGFTGRADLLECHEGFAQTLSDPAERAQQVDRERFFTRDIIFKNHASCYGTHAPIEAARRLREQLGQRAGELSSITVDVEPQYLDVCNIAEPRSGIEAKFSIAHAVALTLAGRDTASAESFSMDAVQDAEVASLRRRVQVAASGRMPRATAEIQLGFDGADSLSQCYDASVPESDIDRQQADVEAKFRAIAAPLIGQRNAETVIEFCLSLGRQTSLDPLLAACRLGTA